MKLKLSKEAPKNWAEKRNRIDDRITKLIRSPKSEAFIEEIPVEKEESVNEVHNFPTVKSKKRLEIGSREEDIEKYLDIISLREERTNIFRIGSHILESKKLSIWQETW